MIGLLPVHDNDVLRAVRGLLRRLLESQVVGALYVPLEAAGGAVAPALVTDPARLDEANPLAPVLPINGARAVAALTAQPAPARLGAVLRSCEIRALIELNKLRQARLADVLIIGLDCPGTYEVKDYVAAEGKGAFDLGGYLQGAAAGQPPNGSRPALRTACQMCLQPAPEHAAIELHLFGADLSCGILVSAPDDLAETLGLAPAEAGSDARPEALQRVTAARARAREATLTALRARLAMEGGLPALLASCIRCHNCMAACPICYCKTCLFRTAAFDHAPDHYLAAARRKGATRLLGDTLLFHMTRLNHMSTSCVGCGVCTSACPAGIPVGTLFSAVAEETQAAFSYAAGRSPDEPLPLITFRADEWPRVGEAAA